MKHLILNTALLGLLLRSSISFGGEPKFEPLTEVEQNQIANSAYAKFYRDESQCGENDFSTPVIEFGKTIRGHFSVKNREQHLTLLTINECNQPPHHHRTMLLVSQDLKKVISDETYVFDKILSVAASGDFEEVIVAANDHGKKLKLRVSFADGKASFRTIPSTEH